MGNAQSNYQGRADLNGPLFGGHYPGDFSIRGGQQQHQPDINKPLPPTPRTKTVNFGTDPAPWVFYKHRPPDENLVNTRYCHPSYRSPSPPQQQQVSPPPPYASWIDEKGLVVQNQ
ncbi:hypothetical protein I350_00898 [Cryptococcus amylolentus CBS 6273]|uniref:Uncharacterized protein n=1 Tax=Cryptococcus amylolentus CBS 6273 TaxID=1296118 RepID=A0A1E3KIG0_9TREE|nr:hypothetical protein I350_00898 [Cryptococcus amylolentus CBS 6273]